MLILSKPNQNLSVQVSAFLPKNLGNFLYENIPFSGPVKIHVQNRKFSLTCGVPPKLVHSWNFNDLRRYGPLENGRFCFEGGSRCGKGEGIHILRLDDPQDLQRAFEEASNSKLESKRKSIYKCKYIIVH